MDQRPVLLFDPELARLLISALHDLQTAFTEPVCVFRVNEQRKRLIQNVALVRPEQAYTGQIHVPDKAVPVEPEAADGRQVVEIRIFMAGGVEGMLGSPQFFILCLQPDLAGAEKIFIR
jgi:hypothetical protein